MDILNRRTFKWVFKLPVFVIIIQYAEYEYYSPRIIQRMASN